MEGRAVRILVFLASPLTLLLLLICWAEGGDGAPRSSSAVTVVLVILLMAWIATVRPPRFHTPLRCALGIWAAMMIVHLLLYPLVFSYGQVSTARQIAAAFISAPLVLPMLSVTYLGPAMWRVGVPPALLVGGYGLLLVPIYAAVRINGKLGRSA